MTSVINPRFIRFQVASVAATAVDFGLTIFLKEVCNLHYLSATSIGTLSGGITNFIICRHWVFRAAGDNAFKQAVKYILIWTCSILLNISFVYLLTDIAGFNYIVSKVITAVIIGITFNYTLQRKFVFVGNKSFKYLDK